MINISLYNNMFFSNLVKGFLLYSCSMNGWYTFCAALSRIFFPKGIGGWVTLDCEFFDVLARHFGQGQFQVPHLLFVHGQNGLIGFESGTYVGDFFALRENAGVRDVDPGYLLFNFDIFEDLNFLWLKIVFFGRQRYMAGFLVDNFSYLLVVRFRGDFFRT